MLKVVVCVKAVPDPKEAHKIKEFARFMDQTGTGNWERRSIKGMHYQKIDKAVYRWYLEQKAAGASVRGADLQIAANRFAKHFKITQFKASYGWLVKFRERHHITKLAILRGKNARLGAKLIEEPSKKLKGFSTSSQPVKEQISDHPNSQPQMDPSMMMGM